MGWKTWFAAMAAIILAAQLVSTAEAATRRKATAQQAGPVQRTVFTYRDESGRRRTKIIVQRRSFLDAGTTVLPGQRKYRDYVEPPFRDPFDMFGPGRGSFERNPIGPRWEFGGVSY